MPKKTKPRTKWGYNNARIVSRDEQERRHAVLNIPNELGLNLSDELKRDYDNAIHLFIANTKYFNNPPNKAEIEAALDALIKNSESFRQSVEDLDYYSELFIERQGIDFTSEPIKETIHNVELIENAATKALILLNKEKSKIGRRPKYARTLLIKKLYEIHLSATGKKGLTYDPYNDDSPYSGSLFDLVFKCLDILNEPPENNASLGKTIQRACK